MRLPVCPHCNTVYRYGDVRGLMIKNESACYHCKKNFKISKGRIWLLVLILIAVCTAVDIISLNVFTNMTAVGVFVINIILVAIALAITPFYIKFKR